MEKAKLSHVLKNSTFLKIWTGIFLSSAATFLALMTLSAFVFTTWHSTLFSNSIVLTQWLPALVALPMIKFVAAKFQPRRVLLFCELGCAVCLLIVASILSNPAVMVAVLLIRGTFDSLSKVVRTVALKTYFSGDVLDRATSYYLTSTLLGGAFGALAGTKLLGVVDLSHILWLCVFLHIGAVFCYGNLKFVEVSITPIIATKNGDEIRSLPDHVKIAIVYFIASICLYQGYHNIARSVFPINRLGLTEVSIPLIQTITNAAYIFGAFAAARLSLEYNLYAKRAPLIHGLTMVFLASLIWVRSEQIGLAVYAVFAFCFELGFCVHQRYIINHTPPQKLGAVMATSNAWSMGLMVAISFGGSYMAEKMGFVPVTLGVAIIAAGLLIFNLARKSKISETTKPVLEIN